MQAECCVWDPCDAALYWQIQFGPASINQPNGPQGERESDRKIAFRLRVGWGGGGGSHREIALRLRVGGGGREKLVSERGGGDLVKSD